MASGADGAQAGEEDELFQTVPGAHEMDRGLPAAARRGR
jgi:hypothetical protein